MPYVKCPTCELSTAVVGAQLREQRCPQCSTPLPVPGSSGERRLRMLSATARELRKYRFAARAGRQAEVARLERRFRELSASLAQRPPAAPSQSRQGRPDAPLGSG